MGTNGKALGSKTSIVYYDARGQELHSQYFKYQLYPTKLNAKMNFKELIRVAYPNCGYATLIQSGGTAEFTITMRS